MFSNEDFADLLVRMPRQVWEDLLEKCAKSGRDPVEEVIYRLTDSLDKDLIVTITTKLLPKGDNKSEQSDQE